MLFKKKLNNVKKRSEYIKSKIILLLCQILAIPEIQETGYLNEVQTYIPKKRENSAIVVNTDSNNLNQTKDKDDSTFDFLCKKNEILTQTETNQIVYNEEESKYLCFKI